MRLIGMVHVLPLPGSPRWDGSMERLVTAAEQHARDLTHRGLADGLVVSGQATGAATPIEDLKRVRSAIPDIPLLVGSGVTPETAAELLSVADALIVGTSLKRDGDVNAPVDPERVRRLVAAV